MLNMLESVLGSPYIGKLPYIPRVLKALIFLHSPMFWALTKPSFRPGRQGGLDCGLLRICFVLSSSIAPRNYSKQYLYLFKRLFLCIQNSISIIGRRRLQWRAALLWGRRPACLSRLCVQDFLADYDDSQWRQGRGGGKRTLSLCSNLLCLKASN